MKRLKFCCPFGGKKYPAIISAAVGVGTAIICTVNLELPADSVLIAMLLAVIVVLLLCYVWEHRLTPAEQEAIANSQLPLWQPVNEDIVDRIRQQKWYFTLEGGLAGSVLVVIGLMICAAARIADGQATLATICMLVGFVILGADFFRNMLWRSVDESAVYVFIPINHMYDVTHHHKDGDYTFSYLVFYQPDGKYVLRARAGSGDYGAIAVVKYHHMLTWVSVPRTRYLEKPEDF